MEGWRKRIGRIAANFEAANKVPLQSSASAQAQPQAQAGGSASQAPQQVCIASASLFAHLQQRNQVDLCKSCTIGAVCFEEPR